jgi:futalosine hydrolase
VTNTHPLPSESKPLSELLGGDGRILLAVASFAELRAVLVGLGDKHLPMDFSPWALREVTSRVDVVLTGVGAASAAGAVASVIDPLRHALVITVGVAGAYPHSPADLGQIVMASQVCFADVGVQTPNGFQPMSQHGFGSFDNQRDRAACAPQVLAALAGLCDHQGVIATVNTCSGTDELARDLATRTGAIAEAMEGAGVALVGERSGTPWAELRAISNTTGARDKQIWKMQQALARLAQIIARLDGLAQLR